MCSYSINANERGAIVGGNVVLGADASLDAVAGFRGAGQGESTFHGNLLGHALWQKTPASSQAIGWKAYASVLWVEGRGPTACFLGDYLTADNVEAYNGLRLYSWWLEAGQGCWSVRAGALLADEEFACTTSGAELLNSAFGWPAFISANTTNTGPAYYAAALGARVAFQGESGWSWQAGVYDGDSFDSPFGDDRPNRHGTHFQLNGGQGAFFITEAGYAPGAANYSFHVGAWSHTADFTDLNGVDRHSGNYGAYVIAERTLAGQVGQPGNIQAHVRAGLAPDDRNEIAWSVDTAVAATGCWARRPADIVTLGFVHAGLSSRLTEQDHEQVVELTYAASLNDHLTLKPDLQYILHTGGTPQGADSLLFILRLSASF